MRLLLLICFLLCNGTVFASVVEDGLFINRGDLMIDSSSKSNTVIEFGSLQDKEVFDCNFVDATKDSTITAEVKIYNKNDFSFIRKDDLYRYFTNSSYHKTPLVMQEYRTYDRSISEKDRLELKEKYDQNYRLNLEYVDKCLNYDQVNMIESLVKDKLYTFVDAVKLIDQDALLVRKDVSSLWIKDQKFAVSLFNKKSGSVFYTLLHSGCYAVLNVLSFDKTDESIDDLISYESNVFENELKNNNLILPHWYHFIDKEITFDINHNITYDGDKSFIKLSDSNLVTVVKSSKLSFDQIINNKTAYNVLLADYITQNNLVSRNQPLQTFICQYSASNISNCDALTDKISLNVLSAMIDRAIISQINIEILDDYVVVLKVNKYSYEPKKITKCSYGRILQDVDTLHNKTSITQQHISTT